MNSTRVGAYYFPNYHLDTRNQIVHRRSRMKWEFVKCARQGWPGHEQTTVPSRGTEAASGVMAPKIEAAVDAHNSIRYVRQRGLSVHRDEAKRHARRVSGRVATGRKRRVFAASGTAARRAGTRRIAFNGELKIEGGAAQIVAAQPDLILQTEGAQLRLRVEKTLT